MRRESATTSPVEIKENLGVVGARIRNAFGQFVIPVHVYQEHHTAERRAGFYTDWMDFEKFVEYVTRYHRERGLEDVPSFKNLSALINTVESVRREVESDLEKVYVLVDQFTLAVAQQAKERKPAEDAGVSYSFENSIELPGVEEEVELSAPRPAAEASGMSEVDDDDPDDEGEDLDEDGDDE